MPIQTYATFLRMTKLCATRVPPKMMSELVPIRVRSPDLVLTISLNHTMSARRFESEGLWRQARREHDPTVAGRRCPGRSFLYA